MTQDVGTELHFLRKQITLSGPSAPGRRVPAEVRARAAEWVREQQLSSNASLKDLAKELGVSWATASRWLSMSPDPRRGAMAQSPAFKRVEVVPEAASDSRSLVVHGPCGLRIEGSVELLAELLRRLA